MEDSQTRRKSGWAGSGLALAALFGLVVMSARLTTSPPAEVDLVLPEMMAEGWLNADGPVARQKLLGKLVVVDCWATWCRPCRAAMPKLAELYARYQPLGVEFVGLTPEPSSERKTIESYVTSVNGFDWPVGYGATPTLDALGIRVLPTVFVFGPQGVLLWAGNHLDRLPEVLDKALAVGSYE